MSTRTLAAWLRCPNCSSPLSRIDELVLGCNEDHRFDVNKRGYVTLLPGRSQFIGDDAAMLDHRAAALDAGAYAPIAAALSRGTPFDTHDILDAGCGTGHYLRHVLSDRPDAQGLAMDLSPDAVRRAVRGHPHVDGIVADTWSPLPIRDARCDLVLNVFAPRNLSEFHRVLRPGGALLIVVPGGDHLSQLRASTTMLDVPLEKADRLALQAKPLFALIRTEHVRYELPLTATLAHHLAAMGPAAHHGATTAPAVAPDVVTVAVDVLQFARR